MPKPHESAATVLGRSEHRVVLFLCSESMHHMTDVQVRNIDSDNDGGAGSGMTHNQLCHFGVLSSLPMVRIAIKQYNRNTSTVLTSLVSRLFTRVKRGDRANMTR